MAGCTLTRIRRPSLGSGVVIRTPSSRIAAAVLDQALCEPGPLGDLPDRRALMVSDVLGDGQITGRHGGLAGIGGRGGGDLL
jgi:hypothetical protein